MNQNTKHVLSLLGDLAILNNKGREHKWGVLFNTIRTPGGDIDEAFTFSSPPGSEKTSVMVRVSEFGRFDYNREAPYYHYTEEGFIRNQLPITIEEIHKKISSFDFRQPIRIPYGNIMNFIFKNFPESRQRSRVRVIIKPEHGNINKGEVLCKFNSDGIFNHPKLSKPIYVDKYSKLSKEDINVNKMYVCEIINETTEVYLANVKKEYFRGIQIGLYETVAGGFYPETERELYDFSAYPEGRVMQIPFILEGNYVTEPVHVDCHIMMECLKLYAGFTWVDLVLGATPIHPLLLIGVKENDDFPKIECFIAPLNPMVGGSPR